MPTRKQHDQRWSHQYYLDTLHKIGSEVKPLEPYVDMHTCIFHLCSCGIKWKVSPQFIRNGGSCKKCGIKKNPANSAWSNEKYLAELDTRNIKVIPLEPYIKSSIKILHKCSCGHEFSQTPRKILRGSVCKRCWIPTGGYRNKEYYKNKPTYLYYIKVNNLYKIGVTLNRGTIKESVNIRFLKDKRKGINISIINGYSFSDGADAFEIEQFILDSNKYYRSLETPLISGNSELFYKDILS